MEKSRPHHTLFALRVLMTKRHQYLATTDIGKISSSRRSSNLFIWFSWEATAAMFHLAVVGEKARVQQALAGLQSYGTDSIAWSRLHRSSIAVTFKSCSPESASFRLSRDSGRSIGSQVSKAAVDGALVCTSDVIENVTVTPFFLGCCGVGRRCWDELVSRPPTTASLSATQHEPCSFHNRVNRGRK